MKTKKEKLNAHSAMESGDHFKNGARLKSLMSRGKMFLPAVLFAATTIGFVSCGDDDEPSTSGSNFTETAGGLNFDMIGVAGGTTTLGTDESGGAKQVTISSFQIGKYEVTQKLWWDVMGSWPGEAPDIFGKGDNYPMYYVSWDDTQDFLTALNNKTGKNYRLPTEAEWEYAAKGGQSTHNYEYSGSATVGDVAWYDENSYDLSESSPDYGTHAVGTKRPNELGIYDMSGNVWEWCNDWYGDSYPSSTNNPTGATNGSRRVLRGGSWNYSAPNCRVSYRFNYSPGSRFSIIGFRLVLPL